MKENLMETFKQGLFLGMLLFICSLTALRLAAPEGVGPVWSLFPAVLSGYLAAIGGDPASLKRTRPLSMINMETVCLTASNCSCCSACFFWHRIFLCPYGPCF